MARTRARRENLPSCASSWLVQLLQLPPDVLIAISVHSALINDEDFETVYYDLGSLGALRSSCRSAWRIEGSLDPAIPLHPVLQAVFATTGPRRMRPPTNEIAQNRDLMMLMVGCDFTALRYADPKQRNDEGLILTAVKAQRDTDRDPRLPAVQDAVWYASERLKGDKEFFEQVLAVDGLALEHAATHLRALPEMALLAVKTTPEAFGGCTPKQRCSRKLALAAVTGYGRMLSSASFELRCDREVVWAAVDNQGTALEFAEGDLKDDPELVLTAVNNDPEALIWASEGLQNDKEIVMAAVRKDGSLLAEASRALRDDDEVVLAAVCNCPDALRHASARCREGAALGPS